MRLMVDDRDKAVKLFRQESGSGQNAGLKQFVQKILPTIEQPKKNGACPVAPSLGDGAQITGGQQDRSNYRAGRNSRSSSGSRREARSA
jgi:uncharacterized protein DUF4142